MPPKADPYNTPIHRRIDIILFAVVFAIVAILLSTSVHAQTTYTWSTSTTTNLWLTTTNWTGNPGHYPGLPTTANPSGGASNDIAAFGSTAISATPALIGIDFQTTGGGLSLGAIDLLATANKGFTIGDGTNGSNGTLTLTGGTLNSVTNTILANEGSNLLTLAPKAGGNKDMTLALGNSTDNVIQINGTGGITISTAITGSGKNLTLTGTGGGILIFDSNLDNTYTGTTTINSGELDLNRSANKNSIAGNLTIGDGVGAANTAKVVINANEQIVNTSDVTINSDGVLNLNNKSETIDGLSASSPTASVALGTGTGGTLTVGASNQSTATFAGVISGTGGNFAKSGNGTQTLTGNNTYTGTTTVNGGTLEIANTGSASSGRISGTSGVTVNVGGTLLLSGSSAFTDRINDSATMTLNGGTLNTGGLSERGTNNNTAGIGAVTLQANSIIDMGSGTSIVAFANSSAQTWTAGTILKIYNWTGTPNTGNGIDQLYFGSTSGGLTPSQLSQIQFYSDNGTTFLGTGIILSNGEVVCPEPSTWAAAALALAFVGFTQRRRVRKLVRAS